MSKTIIAISTPMGESSIGVVRISGEQSLPLLEKCFVSSSPVKDWEERRLYVGKVQDPENGQVLDEAMAVIFPAPHSYTGEDSVEISAHGNPVILKDIVDLFVRLGASVASPGEFTQRAYLNGKMDLSQAEAVNDLIRAHTAFARASALAHLEGRFGQSVGVIHEKILNLLALLEVAIDHSDTDNVFEDKESYRQRVEGISKDIETILSTARTGIMTRNGMRITVVGAPNTGKSSLMNALLRKDRVIVSEIAGTTRDTVEDELNVRGIPVRLIDTAGLRYTYDTVEKMGIERARHVILDADLRLVLFDGSRELTREDMDIFHFVKDLPNIYILNKADLENCRPLAEEIKEDIRERNGTELIDVSAKTGQGLEKVEEEVYKFYFSFGIDPEKDVMVANVRQEGLLRETQIHLEHFLTALEQGMSEEFLASHVRLARRTIEEVTGQTTDDAILDRIFSQFCIGK